MKLLAVVKSPVSIARAARELTDGVNAVVQVPNSASLSFEPTSPMSISLWAYRTGTAGIMHLVSKRSGCGGETDKPAMPTVLTVLVSFVVRFVGPARY